MPLPDLSHLELRESPELPERTLIAPLTVVRELRAALGRVKLDIRVGEMSTVLVSTDLYEAFSAWYDRCATEDAWMN